MAGTLTISTLSDGTNSTSSTNCILGSVKAWVRYDTSATPTVTNSYNVSSVSFVSTGACRVNFTNVTNANYSVVGSTRDNTVAGTSTTGITASYVQWVCRDLTGALGNFTQQCVAVFNNV